MASWRIAVLALVLVAGGCAASSEDPAIIEGGPTRSQALAAVLENFAGGTAVGKSEQMRLEARDCQKIGTGLVNCTVRVYSVNRGWSRLTPGQFMLIGSTWSFAS